MLEEVTGNSLHSFGELQMVMNGSEFSGGRWWMRREFSLLE